MKQPSVSVIMSVYNGQRYLKEAVDSILNQAFKDFEFIVIDDGSTDKTPRMLKDYAQKDPRIKVITNLENIGLTKSLNKAVTVAKGQYIARMDADDISMPERLEKQVDFMEKNSKVGLLGTAYYEVNSKGQIVGNRCFETSNERLKKTLIKYNPFFHASVMIREEVFDKVGLYNGSIPKAQDYELWFRIAQKYHVANLSEPLLKRRYLKSNISVASETEQIFWAQKIRASAIKRKQYSRWNYLHCLRPFFVSKIPVNWRMFLRKYLLKSRVYD